MKWSWRGLLRLCRLSEAKNPHEDLIPGGRNEVELEGIVPALRLCRLSEAKNPHEDLIPGGRNEVELEGIEPSSKQGRTVLSTRLFRTSFSCTGKTRTTNQYLIL